jgi:hypothetical protein
MDFHIQVGNATHCSLPRNGLNVSLNTNFSLTYFETPTGSELRFSIAPFPAPARGEHRVELIHPLAENNKGPCY